MGVIGFLEEALSPPPSPGDDRLVKVTVRIDERVYADLINVGKRLGMSPTRAAMGLLVAAIEDAEEYLRNPEDLLIEVDPSREDDLRGEGL